MKYIPRPAAAWINCWRIMNWYWIDVKYSWSATIQSDFLDLFTVITVISITVSYLHLLLFLSASFFWVLKPFNSMKAWFGMSVFFGLGWRTVKRLVLRFVSRHCCNGNHSCCADFGDSALPSLPHSRHQIDSISDILLYHINDMIYR